jgi:hypothetical protein
LLALTLYVFGVIYEPDGVLLAHDLALAHYAAPIIDRILNALNLVSFGLGFEKAREDILLVIKYFVSLDFERVRLLELPAVDNIYVGAILAHPVHSLPSFVLHFFEKVVKLA